MTTKSRRVLIILFSTSALLATSAAFACKGEGKHGKSPEQRAERFRQSDSNKDGFLTKAEVGERRWERLQVADANKDGKVSLSELEQAKKDGKLHKHGKQGKGKHS